MKLRLCLVAIGMAILSTSANAQFNSGSNYNTANMSYQADSTLSQNIVFDSTMQAGGTFDFSVNAHAGGGRNLQHDTGNLKLEFYNSSGGLVTSAQTSYSNNLLQADHWSSAPGDNPAPWSTISLSYTLSATDAANVAYVKVTMIGTDASWWAGNYGPQWQMPTLTFNGGSTNILYNPEFGVAPDGVQAQGWASSTGYSGVCGTVSGSAACVTNATGVTANMSGGGYSATGGTTTGTAGGYSSTLTSTTILATVNNGGVPPAGSGSGSTTPNYVTVLSNTNVTSVTPTSNNSPAGEGASNALDGNSGTKYLNFDRANAGFTIKLDTPRVIRGVTFTTANDFEARDPSKYSLFGSNDGVHWTTIVDAGSITLSSSRLTTTSRYDITNNDAYYYYFITFPSIKAIDTYGSVAGCQAALGSLACDSVQIADVTYYYDTTYTTYASVTDTGTGTIANPGRAGAVSSLAVPGPVAVTNNSGSTGTNPSGTTTLTVTNAGTYTNNGTTGNVTNSGTFTNNGTTGDITNSGTFNNNGTTSVVDNQSSGTFNNNTGGTTGNVTNAGTFNNSGTTGTVSNSGTFTNNSGGTTGAFTNSGTMTNAGTVASLTNTGTATNSGTITGTVTNTSGTFTNSGTAGDITNSGTVNNTGTVGTVTNDNTFNNDGTTGAVTNNGGFANNGTTGAVTNNGVFVNGATGTTGAFTNAGSLTNAGTVASLVNNGTATNTGTVTGMITNNLNSTFTNSGTTGDWLNNGTMSNSGTMGNGTNTGTFTNTGTLGNVTNTGTFNFNGGNVTSITNSGTVDLTNRTTSSTLTTFTQTSTGSTIIDGNGSYTVNGTATLAGNVTVNNAPTAIGKYNYLTAGSVVGTFDSLTGSTGRLVYSPTTVGLWVLPTTAETQAQVDSIASSMSRMNSLASSSITGGLGSDCMSFGANNGCISVSYGNTKAPSGDLNSAGITVSKAIDPNWRMGVFASQQLNSPTLGSIKYDSSSPAVGGFVGWNAKTDGTGLGITLSATQGDGTYSIGTDKTGVKAQAVQAKATYGINVNDTTSVTPYVGLRRSTFTVNGYTENGPVFPLTYSSVNQSTTDVIAGVGVNKKLTDKLSASVGVGVVHNVARDAGRVNSTSEMGSIGSNIPGSGYTSASVGAGLSYEVAKNQRIGVNVGWQEKNLSSTNIGSIGISYTIGF